MNLGAFSVSLNVSDIEVSKAFYEKLGFTVLTGDVKHDYLIMKQGASVIGLFQDMFANNILTFNPGFTQDGTTAEGFDDIRLIQKALKANGIEIKEEIDENGKGPASFVIYDPDGNEILFDQHI